MSPRLHAFVWAHAAELVDLWIAAWTQAMPQIDFEARRAWFVDHLGRLETQGAALVCAFDAEDGAMLGFVAIDPATHYLDQIAVAPRAQGSGVAGALLDAARRASPQGVRLDVNAGNPRALAFYAREGFVKTGESVNPMSGLPTISLEWRPAASDAPHRG